MAAQTGDAEVDAKVEEWLKWDKVGIIVVLWFVLTTKS
jgi:hypothetical protein